MSSGRTPIPDHALPFLGKRKPSQSLDRINAEGLEIGNRFPNLRLQKTDGNCMLHDLVVGKKTLVVCQAGASHQDQWTGPLKQLELEAWKATPGLPGCTGQLKNYITELTNFSNLGYKIVFLLTDKTPTQLTEVATLNNVPAEITLCSLTPESASHLKAASHPFVDFNGKSYLGRMTYVLDADASVAMVLDRRDQLNQTTNATCDAKQTLEGVMKKEMDATAAATSTPITLARRM